MNQRLTIKYNKSLNNDNVTFYKRTTYLFLFISILCFCYIISVKYSLLTNQVLINKEDKIENKIAKRFFNESMYMGKSHPIDSIKKMLSIDAFENMISTYDNTILDSLNSDIIFHKVENNQTLYAVSVENKVSVENIIKLNNLKNNNIKNGSILKIRKRRNPYGYYGIDVSEWQSKINWNQVHADTIDKKLKFFIIKSTQGVDFVDENYKYNWANAQNANSNIGAYHFYIFKDDPIKQADNYIKNVKLKNGNLFPIIDIEYNCSSCASLEMPYSQFIANLKIFLNRLETHYRCKPIIYSDLSFYNQYLKNIFKSYPIWIAKYATTPPLGLYTNSTDTQNSTIDIWQFSSNQRIKGITGKVDINYIPLLKYNKVIYNLK